MKEPNAHFVRSALLGEAVMDGHDSAMDVQLPRIPERYQEPVAKDMWINGYLTEIRNRMESGGARP